jgi:hypothetical protein
MMVFYIQTSLFASQCDTSNRYCVQQMHLSTIFYTESSFSHGLRVAAYQKRNLCGAAVAVIIFGLTIASLNSSWYFENSAISSRLSGTNIGAIQQLNSTTIFYDLNGISTIITGISNVIITNTRTEYSRTATPRLFATLNLVQAFVQIALILSIVIILLLFVFIYDPIRFAYGNILKRNVLWILALFKLLSVSIAFFGFLGLPDAFASDKGGCGGGPCSRFTDSALTSLGGGIEIRSSWGPQTGWYIILSSMPVTFIMLVLVFTNQLPLTLSKHHRMIFRKKYPNIKFSTTASKSKFALVNFCNLLSDIWNFAFDSIMIEIKTFMVEFELIRPDSDVIIFEDLIDAKYHSCFDCFESLLHPDADTPVIDLLDRIDRFMFSFNIAHSVFTKAVSIPQRSGVNFKVFEGRQADAYLTMKFRSREESKGGSRTIGINPYMFGFSSDENIVDIVDVSPKVGYQAWFLVCFSFGFLYVPLIKFAAKLVLITTSRRIVRVKIQSPASGRVLDPDLTYNRVVQSFFEPCKDLFSETICSNVLADPTKFAKFERTQIEGCFGCCIGRSNSEFVFQSRGGALCFRALNRKEKQAEEFQKYFNHLVMYTPSVCSVDPAYVATSLASNNLAPLNPAGEMSVDAIKERFGPLLKVGEIPLAGVSFDVSVSNSSGLGSVAKYTKLINVPGEGNSGKTYTSAQHDHALLVTNHRVMLYNISKHKPDCWFTLCCPFSDRGKTRAVHSVTIVDAQFIDGNQLFYSGWNFYLCCCGICCKQRYLSPKFDFPRGELLIDGVNFHQIFIGMKMDNPVTNRAFQVVSAVSQAARLQKLGMQAQHPICNAPVGHVFVPEQFSGSPPGHPAAPHTMVEMSVVVSNATPL